MKEIELTEKNQKDIIKKIRNLLEKNGCKDITSLRSYLYKITNVKNGKWYIGSTIIDPNERFSQHKYQLNSNRHINKKLQYSWNKHGEKNFKFEILGKLDNFYSGMIEEQNIIDENFGQSYFYNLSRNTIAPFTGRKHSDKTKEKISKSMEKWSPKLSRLAIERQTGKKHKKPTIQKMKKSAFERDDSNRLEILQSEEFREKQRQLQLGKTWSNKTREKMKLVMNDEYRRKMSETCKKIKKTDEWIDKISKGRGGKEYTVVSPEGKKYSFINVRRFCREYNLSRFKFTDVLKGKRKEMEGWKLSEI